MSGGHTVRRTATNLFCFVCSGCPSSRKMGTQELQYSVHSLCRTCLVHLEQGRGHDLFLVPDLARKLTVCASMAVDSQDGFPHHICHLCFGKLNELHDFQEQCAASQKRFKEMVVNNQVTPLDNSSLWRRMQRRWAGRRSRPVMILS